MSGSSVSRALQGRFEAVRRAACERLKRKLNGLSDADRRSADPTITDVVGALAMVPARALVSGSPPQVRRLSKRLSGFSVWT